MTWRFFALKFVEFPINQYVDLRSCFKDGERVCSHSPCCQCSANLWFCKYYSCICFPFWEVLVRLITIILLAVPIPADTWNSQKLSLYFRRSIFKYFNVCTTIVQGFYIFKAFNTSLCSSDKMWIISNIIPCLNFSLLRTWL
jgi:hypothetical protein